MQLEVERLVRVKSIKPEVAENAGKSTTTFIASMRDAESKEAQAAAIAQYSNDLDPSLLCDIVVYGLVGAVIGAAVVYFCVTTAPLFVLAGAAGGGFALGLFGSIARTKINNGEGVIEEAKKRYSFG